MHFLKFVKSSKPHPDFLPLMESYYTIQGEGFHQGKPAYFIRLGGCDVGCVWCDVKESWDKNKFPLLDVREIVESAVGATESVAPTEKIAIITGGEPLMYNLNKLCKALHKENFKVHIETSGAYPLSGKLDWVCISPKKFKPPLPHSLSKADELKIVIFNKNDFEWAEQSAGQVLKNCKLFLQPEWSNKEKILPLIIDYIKANPKWALSLQIHKYINVP